MCKVAEVVTISNTTSVVEGETALLECVGYGFPSAEVTWARNGQTISSSPLISISEADVVEAERVLRQSTLQISSVEEADAGPYVCVVSNANNISVNTSTQLEYGMFAKLIESATIHSRVHSEVVELVTLSNHTSAREGEIAILVCEAVGFLSVDFSWMHDGMSISTTSHVSITVVQEERLIRQSFLEISNVEASDAGLYICVVSNAETSVNTSTQLTVLCELFCAFSFRIFIISLYAKLLRW